LAFDITVARLVTDSGSCTALGEESEEEKEEEEEDEEMDEEEEDEEDRLDDGKESDDEGAEGGALLTLADVKPAIQAWAVRAGVGTRVGAAP
jgi:hypothetical protein